jgi:hypothetical protein
MSVRLISLIVLYCTYCTVLYCTILCTLYLLYDVVEHSTEQSRVQYEEDDTPMT